MNLEKQIFNADDLGMFINGIKSFPATVYLYEPDSDTTIATTTVPAIYGYVVTYISEFDGKYGDLQKIADYLFADLVGRSLEFYQE